MVVDEYEAEAFEFIDDFAVALHPLFLQGIDSCMMLKYEICLWSFITGSRELESIFIFMTDDDDDDDDIYDLDYDWHFDNACYDKILNT